MKMTKEEAQSIIHSWEDHPDFKLIEDKITTTSRWSEHHNIVIQHSLTEKFYSSYYSRGLTEMQNEEPWEYNEPEFIEVIPIEVKVIKYVVKTP